MYAEGKGVDKSIVKAKEIYSKLAEDGNGEAMFQLGKMAENGEMPDLEEFDDHKEVALDYYLKGADVQNSRSIAKLGEIYEKGLLDQVIDFEEAVKFYKMAIDIDNNPEALNCLAALYYKGEGVNKSYSIAVDMFQEAAKQGNSQALNNLGLCYEFGKGLEKDLQKADSYYEQAIEKENIASMVNKAVVILKTNSDLDPKEYNKAEDLLRRALTIQKTKSALFYLGYIYENGLTGDVVFSLAFKYYEEAADMGHIKAKVKVATALYDGIPGCLQPNKEKAISLIEETAAANDPEALNLLALITEKIDFEKAGEIYKTSHIKGNNWATLNLAMNTREKNESESYFQSSILRGNTAAKEIFTSFIRK